MVLNNLENYKMDIEYFLEVRTIFNYLYVVIF